MKTYKRKQSLIHSIVSAMMIATLFIGLIPTALAADKLPFSDVPSTHTFINGSMPLRLCSQPEQRKTECYKERIKK